MERKPPYNTVSEPYSPEFYQAIKNALWKASAEFRARDAQAFVNSEVRECFLRHGVEATFSACLIHRHFDILPPERNIESNGKAAASADLEHAYPSSWMFCNGKLYPYEYKLQVTACPPADFVKDYATILGKHGFEDLLGFQVYEDGIVGLESTDREAKVSITVDQQETEPVPKDMAPASWAFFRVPESVPSAA